MQQTVAGAVLVGEHPCCAPQADAVAPVRAELWPDARPVRENHTLVPALDASAVLVHRTVVGWDAVRRVEEDSAVSALLTDRPVCTGAVLRRTPRAILENDVAVAPDTPIAVTHTARRAD